LDIKGLAIPPKSYFTGFLYRFEQAESHDPDVVLYDIRKFCALAADGNPNILEVLFGDPADYLVCHSLMQPLLQHRDLFLSTKVQHTFSGYAIAQLKRIRTHRKWLLSPPKGAPTRAEFQLPETTVLPADLLGAVESVLSSGENVAGVFAPQVMTVYHHERAYHNALREWQQYEGWKKNRNKARAETEAKFGYDCKHAMHVVRLMRMGHEILTTGQVIVRRPDAQELLEIRNGAWSYDRLVAYAEERDAALGIVAAKSSLPRTPDRVRIDQLCRDIVEDSFRE
jgi:predicted nucleotidyltransferase